MNTKIKHIKRDTNRWSIFTLTIVCLIALPVFTILYRLIYGPGESWSHIVKTVLPDYLSNSIILMIGCTLLTLIFGVGSAWLVSRFDFPFRKQLEWLLIIPLAIPSYIVAYAYAGIFDYGGMLAMMTSDTFPKVDVMNISGLIWVLSVSLYPYVYVASRAFFLSQSGSLLEASKMLGVGEVKTFFKLILPLARPAVIGGLVLVIMEVLNDYGAAKYYGVSTFTTGIFRAWFALEEPETAIYLSALLVFVIFLILRFEKWQRRRVSYAMSAKTNNPLQRRKTSGAQQIGILIAVSIPVIFGFVLPLIQLIQWAYLTRKQSFSSSFFETALQSFGLGLLAAVVTVVGALMLLYFTKWNKLKPLKSLTKLSTLGYAIPGAVIAVGVLIPTLAFDKWLIGVFKTGFDAKIGLMINGTIIALVYAYMVRFMAVAYNPIEAVDLKINNSLPESSQLLGRGRMKTFFKVQFPLIKTGVLSALLLVFVDIMKELPLTLILKPYDIDTLAVKAYEFASDELIMESAMPSLLIILTGVIPVIFLNKLIIKQ